MKNQKNKGKKIDDKVTIIATPVPDAPDADTPNASAQDDGSADSNTPYLLINRKFSPYSTTTIKKTENKENKFDEKDTFNTPPLPPMHPTMISPMFFPKMLSPKTLILPIIDRLL